jgi:hypothetical protein
LNIDLVLSNAGEATEPLVLSSIYPLYFQSVAAISTWFCQTAAAPGFASFALDSNSDYSLKAWDLPASASGYNQDALSTTGASGCVCKPAPPDSYKATGSH